MGLDAGLGQTAQHFKPVQLGENQIQKHQVRLQLRDKRQGIQPVVSRRDHLHVFLC